MIASIEATAAAQILREFTGLPEGFIYAPNS
jgi:hypothetical protein